MIFGVPDTFEITWCTSSLTTVSKGTSIFHPTSKRGRFFAPLAELSYFKQFTLEGGTLAWPNGADIAPERLYEMTENAKPRGRANALTPAAMRPSDCPMLSLLL